MTAKLCRYGCGVLLEGFDEENRKFLEAGTGGLHTKERCQEAKLKKEQKDDHGNESYSPKTEGVQDRIFNIGTANTSTSSYVDHTQGQKLNLKLKILTDPTPEGLELKYNRLAAEQNIKFSQYQLAPSLYTMAVWYSEESK